MENRFIRAEDVAQELNVSKPYACEIIKYALQNEIKVYLDGGWGVDALLKRESRIHSYRVGVINADNKMITLARIGRIIWIYQIIKRTRNITENNS